MPTIVGSNRPLSNGVTPSKPAGLAGSSWKNKRPKCDDWDGRRRSPSMKIRNSVWLGSYTRRWTKPIQEVVGWTSLWDSGCPGWVININHRRICTVRVLHFHPSRPIQIEILSSFWLRCDPLRVNHCDFAIRSRIRNDQMGCRSLLELNPNLLGDCLWHNVNIDRTSIQQRYNQFPFLFSSISFSSNKSKCHCFKSSSFFVSFFILNLDSCSDGAIQYCIRYVTSVLTQHTYNTNTSTFHSFTILKTKKWFCRLMLAFYTMYVVFIDAFTNDL